MPSFQDSAVIFIIALLLFGPKKLPELARQLGKLMGEFRRASNEFRMQMEDELRMSEQAERQKQIAAMEAAAPPVPVIPADNYPAEEHPHLPPPEPESFVTGEVMPIATSGELEMMPPSTGLPQPRESRSSEESDAIAPLLGAIPEMPEAPVHAHEHGEASQAEQHG
jgi:sec-independent protein translocase protein TatB